MDREQRGRKVPAWKNESNEFIATMLWGRSKDETPGGNGIL
ncbi:hypothetical protein MTO96_018529, partial [Rhipicephalus appendiculatus]